MLHKRKQTRISSFIAQISNENYILLIHYPILTQVVLIIIVLMWIFCGYSSHGRD